MKCAYRTWLGPSLAAMVAVGVLLAPAVAAKRRGRPMPGQFNPDHQSVEMFQAIKQGQIEVKLIPKDSTQCRVIVKNKTDKPLNVELPQAFAGVPVLAQGMGAMGGGAMGGVGGGRGGGLGGSSGSQGFGGGMGMGGMGMGGMGMGGMGGGMGGMGGGMFNIPPEKVAKFKLPTVCLEHGKRDPKPTMKYEIKPIEAFTDKAEVQELCRMLGAGQLNQRAAQVAAWHLSNDMSWQELAGKQVRFANGTARPYFSRQEIQAGMQIVAVASERARQREKKTPPGKQDSLSSQ